MMRVYQANAPFPYEDLMEASKDSHRWDVVFDWLNAGDVIELTEEAEEFDDETDRWLRTFSSPIESGPDDA